MKPEYRGEVKIKSTNSDGEDILKAAIFNAFGPTNVLELVDIPKPWMQVDEVLVRVHAAAAAATGSGRWSDREWVDRVLAWIGS